MTQQEPTQEEEKPTFEDFEEYFESKPKSLNVDLYEKFKNIPQSTIRYWKKKVLDKTKASEPPTTEPKKEPTIPTNKYLEELVKTYKSLTKIDPKLLEGLDINSQYLLLRNAIANDKQKGKAIDPNMKLYTPASTGKAMLGIDEYINIDEKSFKEKGFGKVEINIPASVLFDPEKAKKLGEYQK